MRMDNEEADKNIKRAGCYIKLAAENRQFLADRRSFEWKFILGAWAALGFAAWFVLSPEMPTLPWWSLGLLIAVGLAGTVLAIVLILNMQGSNRKDADLLMYFREKAEHELDDSFQACKRPNESELKRNPRAYLWRNHGSWLQTHAWITLCLFGILVIAAVSSSNSKAKAQAGFVTLQAPVDKSIHLTLEP